MPIIQLIVHLLVWNALASAQLIQTSLPNGPTNESLPSAQVNNPSLASTQRHTANVEISSTQASHSALNNMPTSRNNYNNAMNAALADENGKTDKATARRLTNFDSRYSALNATLATQSDESQADSVERTQPSTLSPINEQKNLLTANSHDEQLNNDISEALINREDIPSSAANSIIATTSVSTGRSASPTPFTSDSNQNGEPNSITPSNGSPPTMSANATAASVGLQANTPPVQLINLHKNFVSTMSDTSPIHPDYVSANTTINNCSATLPPIGNNSATIEANAIQINSDNRVESPAKSKPQYVTAIERAPIQASHKTAKTAASHLIKTDKNVGGKAISVNKRTLVFDLATESMSIDRASASTRTPDMHVNNLTKMQNEHNQSARRPNAFGGQSTKSATFEMPPINSDWQTETMKGKNKSTNSRPSEFINLSTSSVLTTSVGDEENDEVQPIAVFPNATATTLSHIANQFRQTSGGDSLSTTNTPNRHAPTAQNGHLNGVSAINSAYGDTTALNDGMYSVSGYLPLNDNLYASHYVNNFLTAAITEHDLQFSIDSTNKTSNANDRYECLSTKLAV